MAASRPNILFIVVDDCGYADQGCTGQTGRYMTFQMAEVAVSWQMFADILSLIARLRGVARAGEFLAKCAGQ
jgi:hypothetical protein